MEALENSGKTCYPYGNAYSPGTPEENSRPYVISAEIRRYEFHYLVIFDVNGSYFTGRAGIDRQPQYGREDVIIITVNPCAPDAAMKDEMAMNGFWQKYHAVTQTSLSEDIRVPLHLVVTHGDILGNRPDIRGYLISEGYGRMISSLESNFRSVTYHMCDARDHREAAAVLSEALRRKDRSLALAFRKV